MLRVVCSTDTRLVEGATDYRFGGTNSGGGTYGGNGGDFAGGSCFTGTHGGMFLSEWK